MQLKRKSGVLLHISSLPGEYSVGSFGKEACEFVDLLYDSGFSYWQTLPFCMTDDCNSPYKSYASFGANPLFIDLPTLYEKGLITREELESARQDTPYLCEYDRLREERIPLLMRAAGRCTEEEIERVRSFIEENAPLSEAARFLALKDKNGTSEWQSFTESEPDSDVLFGWEFIQYEFFTEWQKVKEYANEKGIEIIGDLPIYVALDSADVYFSPSSFLLDEKGYPTSVAGVPPDYFCEDGQLWNNPLYNWKRMKTDGYLWWRRRIEFMLTLFDGVRIDHFRGFESFYSIKAGAKTAKDGKWVKGPGRKFIDVIRECAGEKLIIAEDLGDITPAVYSLLKYSNFPGMRVVQFAFLGDEKTPHLPHHFEKNCIAYTGTHDNNTLLGYVWEQPHDVRKRIFDYFGYYGNDFSEGAREIIRGLLGSVADTVIMPIQDLLVYGSDTRMNTPGKADGNWRYRVTKSQLSEIDRAHFRYLNSIYGRK